MRSSRCAFSTAAVLHRIFIAPIERPVLHTQNRARFTEAPKLLPIGLQSRSYALPAKSKQQQRRLPRDEEITYNTIYIVSEGNKLSEPRSTSHVLASLDRKTETLVMVSLPPDEQSHPICKIQNKKDLREAEKARTKKKDNPSATVKTIELNWAIDAHDLKHRLEKVKDFLSRGWRVDIIMAGKKGGRKATPQEAQNCLAAVREAITQVEGAKEWKSMNGAVGGMATVYAEGKEQK